MHLKEIETPVSSLSGVGPATAKQLANAGIFSVADLLTWYPRDWEDRTKRVSLCEYSVFPKVHTIAQVTAHEWFGYGRMRTLKIVITDMTAKAELVCFNRSFLERALPVGSIISVTGSFSVRYGKLQSSSFEAEVITKDGILSEYENVKLPDSAVIPVYPLSAGLTQGMLRKIIKRALREYGRSLDDEIPESIIEKRGLLHKTQAVINMHAPATLQDAITARQTLIYEELFQFQKIIVRRALEHKGKLPRIDTDTINASSAPNTEQSDDSTNIASDSVIAAFTDKLSPRAKNLVSRLPFKLTNDQMRVITEINEDIDHSSDDRAKAEKGISNENHRLFTTARLLQGDVGSGKTLVAFFACLRIVDWGGQCAILAPTEILARQHAENAVALLSPLGVRVAFLTGNLKAQGRNLLLNALKKGEIDIVIGTHALFSKNVVYKDLQFVVIDEQHRFGVIQRNAILEKGRHIITSDTETTGTESTTLKDSETNSATSSSTLASFTAVPGLLMMSATPIPRTLALTVFGDLDVSVIRTMPAGRKPIKTYLAEMGDENRVYDYVRKQLQEGRQAYFVYPRIETEESASFAYEDDEQQTTSQNTPLKSAEEMFVILSEQVFPEFKVALIHSKVEEDEQNQILQDFKAHNIDILVATTVVEVGVDVPNANCMVIEHADRFGLAALHQIRGRVGRGTDQSYCFLIFSKKISETGVERMKTLRATTDGFAIAEADLRLRGPGEVTGIQQSGYLTLGIADPVRDRAILEQARADVISVLSVQ